MFSSKEKIKEINLPLDFSKRPSGRFVTDGEFSGERFRIDFLEPIIIKQEKTKIKLDGSIGYSSCFLEEAFGGLVRKYGIEKINNLIQCESFNSNLLYRIKKYINDAHLVRKIENQD